MAELELRVKRYFRTSCWSDRSSAMAVNGRREGRWRPKTLGQVLSGGIDEHAWPGVRSDEVEMPLRVSTPLPDDAPPLPPAAHGSYEYLDHPADVIVHAWGSDVCGAFSNCALGMFAYMSDPARLRAETRVRIDSTGGGSDARDALEGFMEQCLAVFTVERLLLSQIVVQRVEVNERKHSWSVSALAAGQHFDLLSHSQGTEIKAVTKSNTLVEHSAEDVHVYVVVDI